MTDKLRQDRERGLRAQHVMDNPLVKEALDTIRNHITTEWQNSKAKDKEGREEAWKMLKVVNEFERFFVNIMATGKMASQEISRLEQMKQKVSNLWK